MYNQQPQSLSQRALERFDENTLRSWQKSRTPAPYNAQDMVQGRLQQMNPMQLQGQQGAGQNQGQNWLLGGLGDMTSMMSNRQSGQSSSPFGGMMGMMDMLKRIQGQQPMPNLQKQQSMLGQQGQGVQGTQTGNPNLIGMASKLFMRGLMGGMFI